MKKNHVGGRNRTTVSPVDNLYHWQFVSEGYFEAAELIFAQYDVNCFPEKKFLLPMIALYRHSVELSLKGVLIGLFQTTESHPNKKTVDQAIERTTAMNHSLSAPWREIEKILKERNPGGDLAKLSKVAKDIDFLQKTDAKSMVFRYPTDKNAAPNFDSNLSKTANGWVIDPEGYREKACNALQFLGQINEMILGEYKEEFR